MGKPHCRARHHKSGADSNRQLTRLVRKKGSDHCHGCRRPYRHRDQSYIGYDAAGRGLRLTPIEGTGCGEPTRTNSPERRNRPSSAKSLQDSDTASRLPAPSCQKKAKRRKQLHGRSST